MKRHFLLVWAREESIIGIIVIHKDKETSAMEQVQLYVKPLKEFAKDSMRLVKRCTKPDLKGKQCVKTSVLSCFGFRVSEDCHRYGHWLCHHGLHRIFCEADSHPNQQHHCVSREEIWCTVADLCPFPLRMCTPFPLTPAEDLEANYSLSTLYTSHTYTYL